MVVVGSNTQTLIQLFELGKTELNKSGEIVSIVMIISF